MAAATATATATATAMSRLFSLTTTKSTLSTLTFRRTTTTTPSLSLRRNIHHHSHHRRRFSTTISAAISAGDKLPDATFSYLDAENNVQTLTTSDITAAKTAVIFAVPGAFTPTCSQKHVPSFIEHSASLKSKGVSVIACVAVNDAFVMKAWKESLGVTDDSVLFLCDVNGEFTKSIGAELDLTDKPIGLGVRSRRYAMLVDDGVAKAVNMEEGGAFTFSSAEDILKLL